MSECAKHGCQPAQVCVPCERAPIEKERDDLKDKLKVAELQYRELLRASALLSAAVATSGDIHEAVDKLAQVVEKHKTNGGRLEDVLVPLCMGCETSANMEKTWRCKRCSPDKFAIQR